MAVSVPINQLTGDIAAVPATVLRTTDVPNHGVQLQWSDDGVAPTTAFVCSEAVRHIFAAGIAVPEVAFACAWFIGFAEAGPVFDEESNLAQENCVGLIKRAGSLDLMVVAARGGYQTVGQLGPVVDGQAIAFQLKVVGGREGVLAVAGTETRSLPRRTMPEPSVGLALTVALTQTAETARSLAYFGLVALQDRIAE